MNQNVRDFLSFRRMVTPAIIQIAFWVLIGVTAFSVTLGILVSLWTMVSQSFVTGIVGILSNLVVLVVVPLVIRIYCELIIIFFRMNETLTDIRNNTQHLPAASGASYTRHEG